MTAFTTELVVSTDSSGLSLGANLEVAPSSRAMGARLALRAAPPAAWC
jgi:hypothetical protein